jgi:hypothetical protein
MKKTMEQLERDAERKSARRARKRTPRMRVSGKSVFVIQSMIRTRPKKQRRRTAPD